MKKTQKNMPSTTNGEQAQQTSATLTETPLLYHPLSYLECKNGVIEAAFDTEFGRRQLINEGAILSQSRRQVLSRQFVFEKSRNTPSNRNIFIDNAFAPAFNKACLDKGVPNSFSIYQGSDETGNIISEALKLEGFKVGESIKGVTDTTPYRRLKCELKIFFATADIALIGGYSPNNYLFAKIQSWMMASRGDRIDGGKRIKCRSEQSHDGFLNTGLLLTIDGGFTYELAIGIKDIAAIGGQVRSLAGLLKAVGLDTATKGLIQAKDKARMDAYALEHPSEFMAYALADVTILSPLLFEWSNLWSQSYDKMGLTSYFTKPTMSFGKTQSNLILSYFAKALGIAPSKGDTLKDIKDVFGKYNQFGVNALCSNLNSTKVLLALVCGGRAFRKNARLHSLHKLILEYDLAGAYASAMRLLYYPFGCNPVIREYKLNESIKMASVGAVLKSNGVKIIEREDGSHYFDWENSNVPRHGLQMIVNAKGLTYPQDLIPSTNKIDLDNFAKQVRSAEDIEDIISAHDEAFDSEKGINKVHLFDIENGILTTHILDLIGEVCHKRQFNELMKKMKVRTFAFYPAEYEIKVDNGDYQAAYEKMQAMRTNHLQKHRSIAYEKTRYDKGLGHKVTESISYNREPHYWIRIPLAGMIDEFVGQRKIAAIIAGKKKNPLSELFKLQSNGTYGDLVSRYFAFSNPLLANNITAVCRCLVWVAEKTLNSTGSITDGRDCLMNKVLFPGTNQRILMSRVATMHSDLIERGKSIAPIESALYKGEYKQAPLGGGGEILCENEMKEIGGELRRFTNLLQDGKIIASRGWKIGKDSGAIEADNNYQLLDEMVIDHMRQWFPHNHLLNYQAPEVKATTSGWGYGEMTSLFKIENKDIYQEGGAWRGSTDYALFNDGERPNIKARSNELGRTHWELVQDGDVIRFGEECKCLPIVRMMEELKEDNGRLITIPRPVLKEGIVKCGEYKQSPESYQRRGIVVGDSIMKVTVPKIMPLNHHTFISFTQYSGWDKAVSKLEREYGWGIECFFTNETNTHVRYREMNDAILKAIHEGVTEPIAYFTKMGLIAKKCPYQELIEAVKEQLEGYREADATPTMADEWVGVDESSQLIGTKWKKISFKPSRLVDKKDDCKVAAVEPEPMTIEIEGVQYKRKRFSSLRPPKG